jgi:hypothetical protein
MLKCTPWIAQMLKCQNVKEQVVTAMHRSFSPLIVDKINISIVAQCETKHIHRDFTNI